MWLEIKTDLMWVVVVGGGWWVVVGVEGENRNKLGACQFPISLFDILPDQQCVMGRDGDFSIIILNYFQVGTKPRQWRV